MNIWQYAIRNSTHVFIIFLLRLAQQTLIRKKNHLKLKLKYDGCVHRQLADERLYNEIHLEGSFIIFSL